MSRRVRTGRPAGRNMGLAGQIPSARRFPNFAAVAAWHYAPLVFIFAAAVALRTVSGTNVDVSWLLTIGEKMLGGERLYVDLIEVNPPASAFLYLPAILIARATGLSPESVVDALVLFAAAGSMWVAARIMARAPLAKGIDRWSLAAWVATVLTILPMHTFGEREHIATITLLPLLALLAARAGNGAPSFTSALVAGIGAGITVVIKPHFILAVGFAIVAAACARKSWRTIFAVENWIMAGMAAAYVLCVVVVFPEFVTDMMPILQAVYVPVRMELLMLAINPLFLCWVAAWGLLAFWKRGAVLKPPFSILLAASTGFAAAYFIQGKGWAYHCFPMLALAFIALAIAGAMPGRPPRDGFDERRTNLIRRLAVVPAAVIAVISGVWLNVAVNTDALMEPIRQLKARPSLLIISADIAVGHPLVRRLGGKWASRVSALWISAGVIRRMAQEKLDPDTERLLQRYAELDREMLAEDICRNRPDIIVVDNRLSDARAWARRDPVLVERLKDYREAAVIGAFVILWRPDGR